MRAVSIMYHDVVNAATHETSGFPGRDAAIYKVDEAQFKTQLAAIAGAVVSSPLTVVDLLERGHGDGMLLTFDDGGASAHGVIADMLEDLGWKGHFFVTSGYIGSPSFLSKSQIRDLHSRGHVIGSHSHSHPERFSHCSADQMKQEWTQSTDVLSDIVGERVATASVPGGFFSRTVAETAAQSGIKAIFNSEPTTRLYYVDGCLVLGRYAVQRWMAPRVVAGLAGGSNLPRFRQLALWKLKRATKAIGGKNYLRLRKTLLRGRS